MDQFLIISRGMILVQIIEEFESSIKMFLYGKKARSLGVSPYMLYGRIASDGIDICKLIKNSNSSSELYKNVCSEIDDDKNTDYLHFSLIMGLYFGCFNLYNYLYITNGVRKRIVECKPNRRDTMNFIIRNYSKLFKYFSLVYGINDNEFKNILSKMLFLVKQDDDNYLYNSDIVKDFGKILIANSIFDDFNDCFESIVLFDELNEFGKSKIY